MEENGFKRVYNEWPGNNQHLISWTPKFNITNSKANKSVSIKNQYIYCFPLHQKQKIDLLISEHDEHHEQPVSTKAGLLIS